MTTKLKEAKKTTKTYTTNNEKNLFYGFLILLSFSLESFLFFDASIGFVDCKYLVSLYNPSTNLLKHFSLEQKIFQVNITKIFQIRKKIWHKIFQIINKQQKKLKKSDIISIQKDGHLK